MFNCVKTWDSAVLGYDGLNQSFGTRCDPEGILKLKPYLKMYEFSYISDLTWLFQMFLKNCKIFSGSPFS